MQTRFTQEEWYYLRKIHKKENNFFLNKNGKIGDVGAGWVELSSKHSKSAVSTVSQKSGACNCQSEETKGQCACFKKQPQHSRSERTRTRSFSDSSNSRMSADYCENDHRNTAAMNMIDEAVDEDENSDNSQRDPHDSLSTPLSSNDMSIDESFNDWNLVSDRKERLRQGKATINLKDLTESDFLELIEAKNQDKRFFGWLNF